MRIEYCIDDPGEIASALSLKFSQMKMTQYMISIETGVHQSQVSRILSGGFQRRSSNVIKLCKYAKIEIVKSGANPANNKILIDALTFAWDGTDKDAEAIAQVLRAVGELRKTKRAKSIAAI